LYIEVDNFFLWYDNYSIAIIIVLYAILSALFVYILNQLLSVNQANSR